MFILEDALRMRHEKGAEETMQDEEANERDGATSKEQKGIRNQDPSRRRRASRAARASSKLIGQIRIRQSGRDCPPNSRTTVAARSALALDKSTAI